MLYYYLPAPIHYEIRSDLLEACSLQSPGDLAKKITIVFTFQALYHKSWKHIVKMSIGVLESTYEMFIESQRKTGILLVNPYTVAQYRSFLSAISNGRTRLDLLEYQVFFLLYIQKITLNIGLFLDSDWLRISKFWISTVNMI